MVSKSSKKPFLNNLTVIIIIVLLVGGAFYMGGLAKELKILREEKTVSGQTGTANSPEALQPQIDQQVAAIAEVSQDDDPQMGDKNAPVTMIEFSDYECPYCKQYFNESLPQIKKNFVDQGKLKIIYRDLPLPFHEPMATREAIAANCARDQGGDQRYFAYHDEIFKRTKSNGNGLNQDDLSSIAEDLGLNKSRFSDCLKDEKQNQEVQKDLADARAVNADGTPTFFIGKSSPDGKFKGERLIGAQPYSAFEAVINKYLAN